MQVRLDIHPRGLSTCVIVIVMALADAAGPGPDRPVMIPVEKKKKQLHEGGEAESNSSLRR